MSPDAAMRPPWVAISPSRISRRPIRASKVTDIHPVTSQSSLRLPSLAGIGKTEPCRDCRPAREAEAGLASAANDRHWLCVQAQAPVPPVFGSSKVGPGPNAEHECGHPSPERWKTRPLRDRAERSGSGAIATSRMVANNVCFQVVATVTPMADMRRVADWQLVAENCPSAVGEKLPVSRLFADSLC